MQTLTVKIFGPPVGMGSKRAFIVKAKAQLVDANSAKLRSFQAELKDALREAMHQDALNLMYGPVGLEVEVVMQRPKSHYGTGKNALVLKPDAPHWCQTKPDLDKVIRAVGDCATGIVVMDDAQFASLGESVKRYQSTWADTPGVRVTIWELDR